MQRQNQPYRWDHELETERAWASPQRREIRAPSAPLLTQGNRTAMSERDKTLSSLGVRWLDSLPTEVRPAFLAEHYPRIVNRIAMCWADPALTVGLFREYFVDRRGTRKGFPAQARAELKRLRGLADQRLREMHG